jgi:hypothetical protein
MRAEGLRPRRLFGVLTVTPAEVLPSASLNSVGSLDCCISRLNGSPASAPVNASRPPSQASTHDSGSEWLVIPSLSDSFIQDLPLV